MRPDLQPTAQQFQQFGANRFLGVPPGVAPQQGVPTEATVAGAPAAASIFTPAMQGGTPISPGQALPDLRAFIQSGETPVAPGQAQPDLRAFIQQTPGARPPGYVPPPAIFGQAQSEPGTTNPLVAEELRRRREQALGQPGQAVASQPGLDWLRIMLAGGQPPQSRQASSIPGVAPFPSQQTFNQLLPSQVQGFQAAVQSTGVPWLDYQNQLQKTFNYQPAPRLRLQPRGV
mgnify:CR=1 FL=1